MVVWPIPLRRPRLRHGRPPVAGDRLSRESLLNRFTFIARGRLRLSLGCCFVRPPRYPRIRETISVVALAGAVVALGTSASALARSTQVERIVFESNRNGMTEIYVMSPDGSDKRRLTKNKARDAAPAWSPDAREIAFVSGRAGNWELYRMTASGSGQTRLTTTTREDEFNPDWSPNGRSIAFESQRGKNSDIKRIDVRKRKIVPITSTPQLEITPAWSPDGTRVAYAAWRNGDFEIVTNELATGRVRMLTNNAADDVGPQWSPDGRTIAFARLGTRAGTLVTVPAIDGRERALKTGVPRSFGPVWSPDGKAIVFNAPSRLDRAAEGEYELFKMTLATGEVQPLTTSYPGRDVAPDWASAAAPMQLPTVSGIDPDPPASFCTWVGSDNAETKYGAAYSTDVLCGKAGGDTLYGRGGSDTLKAGYGGDIVYGNESADDFVTRWDGSAHDSVRGGDGADEAWIDCGHDDYSNTAIRCG